MIAAWMLYLTLVAAVLAVAALAAERGLRLYQRPARFVWLAAMLGTFALPLLTRLGGPGGPGEAPGGVVFLPAVLASASNPFAWVRAGAGAMDRVLLAAWGGASALLLVFLSVSLARLRREGAGWTRSAVDGWPVLVSPDLGPAVLGLSSPAVVIPRWFFDLPGDTQRLALLHEREHLEAGDTRILALGLALAALVPWNLALWWQVLRLRAAVELDCDGRVLRAGVSVGAYANALLEVGARKPPRAILQPALAEPRPLLSRRIVAMFTKPGRTAWLRAGAYGAAVALFVLLACETPAPERMTTSVAGTPAAEPIGVVALGLMGPNGQVPERVSCPPPQYPAMLLQAGVEGQVRTRFVVGTDGRVEPGSVEILSSSQQAFEAPTRYAIENCVFRAGKMNGKPVRVVLEMPFRYVVAR